MRALIAFLVALLLATGPSPASAAPAPPRIPGQDRIRAADLMRTVESLASPRLGGRLAGSPGHREAAREMARRFADLGLRPGGEDGFLQHLEVEYQEIDTCRLALVGPDGSERALRLGPDFLCRGLTGSGSFTAPVAFVGYGLSAPEKGYDDYAGIDVDGKVVLTFKTAPPFRMDSLGWGESAMPRPKGLTAAAHGARGLLFTAPADPEGLTRPIGSVLEGPGSHDQDIPRLIVDLPVAREMLASAGLGIEERKAAIDSTREPHSRDLGVSARVEVAARYEARRPSSNVIGILEGSDPVLRDQAVVVGAHLDHLGGQAGLLFPGANDNASGVAAVLGAARALVHGGARPKRSVIFVLFTGEESGLHGSRHFVAHPPVPLESIVAFLNLDCVGHGDSIQVGCGKTCPRLWELARDLDRRADRLTVEETWAGGGADADPFAERGIPTLYFASKFSYTHIHAPSDRPDTLNPPLLEAVARLVHATTWTVAQGDYEGE